MLAYILAADERGLTLICVYPRKSALPELPISHVRKMSLDRRRRRHHRTDEMRAAAASLPSLEVAITRRRAALTRLQNVVIHSQTHRASRFAPLKPRFIKDPIEALAFRRALHLLRA